MSFRDSVLNFVQKVPKGRVVSYGQLAAVVGSPRAARQVGWVLRTTDPDKSDLPWWRVVNAHGQISIKGNDLVGKETQKLLLEEEGIEVKDNYQIDIDKYKYTFK